MFKEGEQHCNIVNNFRVQRVIPTSETALLLLLLLSGGFWKRRLRRFVISSPRRGSNWRLGRCQPSQDLPLIVAAAAAAAVVQFSFPLVVVNDDEAITHHQRRGLNPTLTSLFSSPFFHTTLDLVQCGTKSLLPP